MSGLSIHEIHSLFDQIGCFLDTKIRKIILLIFLRVSNESKRKYLDYPFQTCSMRKKITALKSTAYKCPPIMYSYFFVISLGEQSANTFYNPSN